MKKHVLPVVCILFHLLWAGPAPGQQRLPIGGRELTVYPIPPHAPPGAPPPQLPEQVFSNTTIVGMGEATHGTSEFFTLRHRFFQFLAARHRYRTFAIEATLGGALFINDYVTEGTGNIDSLISKLDFWMYHSQELKTFIEWMRAYNTGKPPAEQLTFYGFDLQSVQRPAEYLAARVEATALPAKDSFVRMLAHFTGAVQAAGATKGKTGDTTLVPRLLAVHEQLNGWLQKAMPALGRWYTGHKVRQLELCLLNLRQALLNINSGAAYRDSCMAMNVQHIRALEQSNMMLWAHNVHIGRQDPAVDYRDVMKPMGEHLHRAFGAAYYPIGFIFNQGSFTAIGLKKKKGQVVYMGARQFRVGPLVKGGIADVLSGTGIPCFFIPLQQGAHPLFSTYQKTYLVGATYSKKLASYAIYFTPDRMFSGLVFVDTTTGLHLLGNERPRKGQP